MESKDQDDFACSQQLSSHTNPSQNINQMNPDFIYSMPPHNINQFNPVIYHTAPPNGMYPLNLDLHNTHRFSYQDMLNVPISNPQCSKPVKALKKAAKDSQNSNTSQLSIAKKDWTTKEEEALTEAWLYISVDADVGNNQKNSAMWARVLHIWKQKMGPDHYTMRNNNSLQCHWFQIRSAVSKFVAKYEQLERHPQSGTNSQDLVIKTLRLYEDFFGSPFKFLHCWKILVKKLLDQREGKTAKTKSGS